MKKNILIISYCTLLSFLSTRASGQESLENQDPVEAQLVSLSVDFFKHMASSKYSDASALFHYPKEYTSKKKAEQILDVSKLLKIFTYEFGLPSNHKTDKNPTLYYNIAVSGGDTSYWKGHPSFLQITLEVHFGKENKSCRVWSAGTEIWSKRACCKNHDKNVNFIRTKGPRKTNKGKVPNIPSVK